MGPAITDLFSGDALVCVRGSRLVFQGLDFALKAGEALVLTGPNGSGKSSLLRLMAGLAEPAGGQITWNGLSIAADRQTHAAHTQYIGHATGAKAALSAGEDLAFWCRLRGIDDPTARRHALEGLGLGARTSFPVRFLSSGQKRRLALARLIAAPAPLWLLDEPTVGLDAEGQAALETAIARHRGNGGLVVIASHTPIDLGGDKQVLDLGAFADGLNDAGLNGGLGMDGGA